MGVIRKPDSLGRLVIPSHIRKEMKWDETTPLEIFADAHGVLLQKYTRSCTFCEAEEDIQIFKNKPICKNCIALLQK